jgi:cysteine desulfurase
MLKKPNKVKYIYLDHSATTPVCKEVLKAMTPYFSYKFGNPSALHKLGREAKMVLEESRKIIARYLKALPENIIFTSGGTEANNLAIFGVAKNNEISGRHLISMNSEHPSIIKPLADLQKSGWQTTYIKPNKEGLVDPAEIIKAITPETVLVSIMYANNETGAIQPIAEIGREILKYRKKNNSEFPYFHTDACQAAGYLDLDVEKTHVDLMTINSGKIYGPKGVGFLYIRRGVKIKPLFYGGEQEARRRAGTENITGIVGMAQALVLAQDHRENESKRLRYLSTSFLNKILEIVPDVKLNSPIDSINRLPGVLNISFRRVEGEAMLLYLDEFGIMCSTGSACTSLSLSPSQVLKDMGLSDELAHGSLRFSMGRYTKKKDLDYVIKYLPEIINFLRELSTLK